MSTAVLNRAEKQTNQLSESQQLEEISDSILKSINAASDSKYPAYDELYFQARERRRGETSLDQVLENSSSEMLIIEMNSNVDAITSLCKPEIRRLMRIARLTDRQRDCLEYAILGFNYAEIGRELNISRSMAQQHTQNAVDKLSACEGTGLFTVMYETFGWYAVQIVLGQ